MVISRRPAPPFPDVDELGFNIEMLGYRLRTPPPNLDAEASEAFLTGVAARLDQCRAEVRSVPPGQARAELGKLVDEVAVELQRCRCRLL